ncbi:CAF17-like 4Fe-4S cluster assembly/insertion protein YgfZ [Pseudomonas massiliensis]|uniref:CAF17-like 4Fe-4S cluster assembly/insertion protein YgfZ n=1 Tax=Pseudomonas massiliensis TaxID=522492 RepID=UPI00058D20E2|nr:folate-binding protein YgfZ [Pseudomonas massiliensis]
MSESAFFCVLNHEGILAVRGSDAGKFLQGQLTCNINYLNPTASSLGARCTPKGRMQSSFRIVGQADGYLLALAAELLEPQLADLKKYAVFSKATLTDESPRWVRFGLSHAEDALKAMGMGLPGEPNEVLAEGEALLVRVSPGRIEAWLPVEQAEAFQARLGEALARASLDEWLLGQVRAGIGQVFGPTRELFIPQMINLQAVGGVSFKKGCYTGQEIVARMQYLGKLKRRQYRLALGGNSVPAPGTELFSSVHASAVGEVVLGAPAGDGVELLAVLQDNAVEQGDIRLGSLEGPRLGLLDLPYELDRDREIQR